MAKEIINEDFELPSELDEGFTAQGYVAGAKDDDEVEYEIVDDTPDEDKNRKPRAAEADPEQEDELDNYSEKVQKRINQINHKYHDERREKERLAREHAEAMRIAQAFHERVQQLESTLTWGQQEYTKEAQGKIEYAEQIAQDKLRRAFESGDTEGFVAAQQEIITLANQKNNLQAFGPPMPPAAQPANPPLQQQYDPVYNTVNTEPEPAPRDYKAEDWASRNPWFGKDEEMTAFAYGLHEKLVKSGVDPTSDEYYQKVDSRIREIFPKNFERPKKASPVASVGRTSAPKKVTLTATQVAIAKRLGVPLEVYAKHAAKEQQING